MPFRQLIAEDPEVRARIPQETIGQAFDPWDQLQHIDATFERLGLLQADVMA
jgi:hypothetical protein